MFQKIDRQQPVFDQLQTLMTDLIHGRDIGEELAKIQSGIQLTDGFKAGEASLYFSLDQVNKLQRAFKTLELGIKEGGAVDINKVKSSFDEYRRNINSLGLQISPDQLDKLQVIYCLIEINKTQQGTTQTENDKDLKIAATPKQVSDSTDIRLDKQNLDFSLNFRGTEIEAEKTKQELLEHLKALHKLSEGDLIRRFRSLSENAENSDEKSQLEATAKNIADIFARLA